MTMQPETLDTRGMKCPRPLLEVHKRIRELVPGDRIRVLADDPAFKLDIEAWCRRTGNPLDFITGDDELVAVICKAS